MKNTHKLLIVFGVGLFLLCLFLPSGFCADLNFGEEFTVFKVEVIPLAQNVEDGLDSATFTAKITPSNLSGITYNWISEFPEGAGNNPQVDFSSENQQTTKIQNGHWFDADGDPCTKVPIATYSINVQIKVNNTTYTSPTPADFNVTIPNEGGVTTPQRPTGFPSLTYDSNANLWRVSGIGYLVSEYPATEMKINLNSQFYKKAYEHEMVHVNDLANGFDGHQFWSATEFYDSIKNLTAPLYDDLVNAINHEYILYDLGEQLEYETLRPCFEYRAHQVSDPITPQYYYQNCGHYSSDDCQ